MNDTKDLNTWKSLFRTEQKGKNPEEFTYAPIEGLQVLPYSTYESPESQRFEHQNFGISHSLIVESGYRTGFISEVELDDYQVDFMKILPPHKRNVDDWLSVHRSARLEAESSEVKKESIFVINAGKKDVLDLIRKNLVGEADQPDRIALIPGEDFIWNVALCRGVFKYFEKERDEIKPAFSIYLPMGRVEASHEEGQLISLTSQILSMMVGGLAHVIWEVRNASSWQLKHFHYLLNIPEILVREGQVLVSGDPLEGSGIWEELSDRVSAYIHQ